MSELQQREGQSVGRNLRNWWVIPSAPYPGAHFATFPRKLVEPCVKAGTSERGVCPECGAPWVRVVERHMVPDGSWGAQAGKKRADAPGAQVSPTSVFRTRLVNQPETTGWRSSCLHDAPPVPATVLDIFAGSGTVGVVAQSLSRRAVLIDLNPAYLVQAMERNRQTVLGLPA